MLASRSPQRRAILDQLGIAHEVRPADVEEAHGDAPPQELVASNALRKALAVAQAIEPARLVLGADTVVALGASIYGKPRDEDEARSHLLRLSGAEHEVWSALAFVRGEQQRLGTARTRVRFRRLDEEIVEWYLGAGEWRERAGGYAIQGRGAALVEGIDGDYWNVVGLPVSLLVAMEPQLFRSARSSI